MEQIQISSRAIPLEDEVDVFVAGGGCAGVGAAIAAARSGMRVFLAERLFCLGGMMTAGLMSKIALAPQNHGIAEEIIQRMDALQGTNYLKSRPEVPIDPETAKTVLDEMVIRECGVDVRFGTVVSGVIKNGRNIEAAIISNIDGERAVKAKYYIDCTGDGQLAFLAGAEYMQERGELYSSSPTLMFRVANCDIKKTLQYMDENPSLFQPEYVSYGRHLMSPKKCAENWDNQMYVHIADFVKFIRLKCAENRELFSEEEETVMLRRGILLMNQPEPNHVLINSTTTANFRGDSSRELSEAIVDSRNQCRIMARFLKAFVPGFEDSFLIDTASQMGVRESRRIRGDYVFTQDDVENLTRFEDGICSNHGGVEIHKGGQNNGLYIRELGDEDFYDVPYRCIIAADFDNLYMAGRCFSASHSALSAARNIAYCCALGEACGRAAGLLICAGKDNVRAVDIPALRKLVHKNLG